MPAAIAPSLSETCNAVNDAAMFGRRIPAGERKAMVDFIASCFGGPRAYAGTFSLTPAELTRGIRLFTGERATSASARHIAGEEACRALLLLKPTSAQARKALRDAGASLARCVGPSSPTDPKPEDGQVHWFWPYRGGTYCCGACSVGFWRHLLAGGFDDREARLDRGLKCLKTCQKGDGQWRVFPFWYTLLALVEMESGAAREQMRYAAARCERALRGRASEDAYVLRRREIARRVLAIV